MNADHGSAETVFGSAQTALGAGDLVGAFAHFDRPDLMKIAINSVRALSVADPGFDEACERFGFDRDARLAMRELTDPMAASAALLQDDPASFDLSEHRQIAKDYEAAIKDGFSTVRDLPGFTAALEQRMRARLGGGSISTSLFSGETLTVLVVEGKKAWATRVESGREIDDIGFVLKRDGRKIKLSARRPPR